MNTTDKVFYASIIAVIVICISSIIYGFATAEPIVSAETQIPNRYVSDWIKILPDTCINDAHGLPSRPMIVEVWVMPFVAKIGQSYPVGDVLPYVNFNIQLRYVSVNGIQVCNYESETKYIQIVAED